MGESDHSGLQAALTSYLFARRRGWKIRVFPEQRGQVSQTRFRVPDICVLPGLGPTDPIITRPPFICIEILSKDDSMESMQGRIDHYVAFGVPRIWLIYPRSLRAFVYSSEGSHILVPLPEIFQSLE